MNQTLKVFDMIGFPLWCDFSKATVAAPSEKQAIDCMISGSDSMWFGVKDCVCVQEARTFMVQELQNLYSQCGGYLLRHS